MARGRTEDHRPRAICAIRQLTRARNANPFEAETFGIPDGTTVLVAHATTYDAHRHPIEHSRYTWPREAVRISDYYTYTSPTSSR